MIRMPLATASLLAIAISLAGCGEGKDKAAAAATPTPAASTAAAAPAAAGKVDEAAAKAVGRATTPTWSSPSTAMPNPPRKPCRPP